jgi:hypothetical protein
MYNWESTLLSCILIKKSCGLDIDSVTGDRVYGLPANSIQDTDPTCDLCSYTTAPPDNDIRILQRIGTFAYILWHEFNLL